MSIRFLTDHKVNPANDVTIAVTDAPGSGGANHRYEITDFYSGENPSVTETDRPENFVRQVILFQNGPIAEAGINGVTQEALLAIVADRLRSFEAGPFACRENALALQKVEEAMYWLHARTRARMARGVEGTHQK